MCVIVFDLYLLCVRIGGAAVGCTIAECCWDDPTCDNIDGHGAGTGSGTTFSSCVSGVNHLKDDLSVMCHSKTCDDERNDVVLVLHNPPVNVPVTLVHPLDVQFVFE